MRGVLAPSLSALVALAHVPGPNAAQDAHGGSPRVRIGTGGGAKVIGSVQRASGAPCEPAWTPTFGKRPGADDSIYAMAVFDDGGGPALHVAGAFSIAGSEPANRIAKWDGTGWSPLGSGLVGGGSIYAMAVFDDGGGPALFVGGEFTGIGGVPAARIARWDGTSWSALGSGMNGFVLGLTVFDDGAGGGPALHAGGSFTSAGGMPANRVAKWDGTSWSPLGSGLAGGLGSPHQPLVYALEVFDDGGGLALYAGGNFTTAGGAPANYIAKWDGASWTTLGSGVDVASNLIVFDDGSGSGPALYVGGDFEDAGGVPGTNHVAKWDGASWSALDPASGLDEAVYAMVTFDDGTGDGPALYAGGNFTIVGDTFANHVARWDGTDWSPLGSGLPGWSGWGSVSALAVYDEGDGPALFAGGSFWTSVGAAGNRIARWDGASWSALGSGIGTATSDSISALAVYDDGAGPVLYAGGGFTSAGGAPANAVARWNGAAWSPLPGIVSGFVRALAVFDDGGGPALYASGTLLIGGSSTTHRHARWDGMSWTPLELWGYGHPYVLSVFDDGGGAGPALYSGGGAQGLGFGVKRWDGTSWSPVGGATNEAVLALAAFDDRSGTGPALIAGGLFTNATDSGDSYIASWRGCDTFPPLLSCPEEVVALDAPSGPPGEVVHFAVPASDGSDPFPTVVCVPPSGSFFPRGATLVTCTAADAAGNQATCEFPVTVLTRARRR